MPRGIPRGFVVYGKKIIFFMDDNEVGDYLPLSSRTRASSFVEWVKIRRAHLLAVDLTLHDSHALMRKIYVVYHSMLLV